VTGSSREVVTGSSREVVAGSNREVVAGSNREVVAGSNREVVTGSSRSIITSSRQTNSQDDDDDDAEMQLMPCDGSVPLQHMKPPKLKSAGRCVDKADIAYRGDVSRMMDVCRETVYFDTVEDLHACLEALVSDVQIVIVRVKSTMTRAYSNDSLSFSGYRLVMCVLLFVHVCCICLYMRVYVSHVKIHADMCAYIYIYIYIYILSCLYMRRKETICTSNSTLLKLVHSHTSQRTHTPQICVSKFQDLH
jgi:hypothetical protein